MGGNSVMSSVKGNGVANVFLCHVHWESFENHISIWGSSEIRAPTSVSRRRPIAFSLTVGEVPLPLTFPSWRERALTPDALISLIPIRVYAITSRPSWGCSWIILRRVVSAQIQPRLQIHTVVYPSDSHVGGNRDTGHPHKASSRMCWS